MSLIDYISFPKKIETPYSITEDDYVVILDKKTATFDNCFKNPFVYELYVASHPAMHYHIMDIVINPDKYSDEKEKKGKVREIWNANWIWKQKNQYDIFHKILSIGEFVEIYTVWLDDSDYNFSSPLSEYCMTLGDFLDMPMPENDVTSKDGHKLLENRHKLTIHKTK